MDEWRDRLAEYLTQGDLAALPEVLILIGALIGCSLFALIQFFTMMMSRWGDKNPAPKSFVLSILVHVVVMLAWSTAIAIHPSTAVMALPRNVSEPIPIRELVETDLDDPFDQGETPIWKKLSDVPDVDLSRQDREAYDAPEMAEAPLQPNDAPTIDRADLAELSVQPTATATPDQQLAPADMPRKATPVPATPVDVEATAEARAEATASAPARVRPRMTQNLEVGEEVPKTRGSEDAAAPNRPDDQSLSIPLNTAGDDDESPVLDGRPSDTIRRGAAPSPSNAPDGEFIPDGRTDADGPPSTRKFDRSRVRRPVADGAGEAPLPARIPGEGRPASELTPDRLTRPSPGSPGDSSSGSPTPSLAPGTGPNLPNRSPATYKLRHLEQRRGTALKQGGSLESERAVENSLKWLAKVQEPAGYWSAARHGGGSDKVDPEGHPRQDGGKFADSGVTGLALLAFMGAGYTSEEGEYAPHVSRGLDWLIRQQKADGYLGGGATHLDEMYCHAIATIALAEACGMQEESARPPELLRAIKLAVDYIVERQLSDGGWRYANNTQGDMSMFGWQLMALKSADIAGVKIKPEVWLRMIEFLKSFSQGEHGGLAGYNIRQYRDEKTDKNVTRLSPPTPAMSAEALFCKQMIGIRRTNPASQEAVSFLRRNLPRITSYDEYYWYYGTLAMFQQGGEDWDEWNESQRDLLVRLQETSGRNAGSWAPKGKWAGIGGRVYSTALSTLILEVYYRYLPLYQATQE